MVILLAVSPAAAIGGALSASGKKVIVVGDVNLANCLEEYGDDDVRGYIAGLQVAVSTAAESIDP